MEKDTLQKIQEELQFAGLYLIDEMSPLICVQKIFCEASNDPGPYDFNQLATGLNKILSITIERLELIAENIEELEHRCARLVKEPAS